MNPGLGFLRALFGIPNHRDPKPLLEVDDFGYPQLAWISKTVFVFFGCFPPGLYGVKFRQERSP